MTYRCPNCGSDRPGQHYDDMCVGDATLRPLSEQLLDAVALVDKASPKLDVAYWRLADEDDPDGMVVGVDSHGQASAWMPRADWDQLRASLRAGEGRR